MDYNLVFDFALVAVCVLPAYYSVRTLIQIYHYEELSVLKYEWVPILLAGLAFVIWILEGAYFDLTGNISIESNGVKDATLFAVVSIFAVSVARFADTWGGYVKKMKAKREIQEESL